MPPRDAERQPPGELRRAVLEWIGALRRQEARRSAGDPGPVLARRLSNAEYDNTIRDLTGVDLRPTREFPVDPANEAGFDNSGESLAMSATLLKKYLEAARLVAEHVVLKPSGFVFAPHPVVTDTDRDKYCVKRIVDFYKRQPTDLAAYFVTDWRFKHRAALGRPEATLADFAARDGVSPRYLATIWSTLEGANEETGPIAWLREMWRELPAPRGPEEIEGAALRGCERMRELVINLRPMLTPEIESLASPGIARGSQAFVLWKDRQYAANRQRRTEALRIEAEPHGEGPPDFSTGGTLVLPHDETARRRLTESLARFCEVFPDAFYLSERGLVIPDEDSDGRGRLLSAGFHLMIGYFRDDAPHCALVLDEPARREGPGARGHRGPFGPAASLASPQKSQNTS